MIKISPSMLSCDFAHIGRDAALMERSGADLLHLDIMDGSFVPKMTFGADIVAAMRPHTALPFDVHLMIVEPDRHIADFAKAGASMITVHAEACRHLQRTVRYIKDLGCRAGVALNPATPLDAVKYVMDDVDMLLVMTVNPGYGGQKLIPAMYGKIAEARAMINASGRDIDLEIDGGANGATAPLLIAAGANVIVSGSYIFAASDPAAAVASLRVSK